MKGTGMPSVARTVLTIARSQTGYVEHGGADGRSGNITKYWEQTEPRLQGASWCADFVSWCFEKAGHPLPDIDRPYGYINCADAVAYAKAHHLWDSSGHYRPGDIVFYCWDGSGVAEHTGVVVSDDGHELHTIEGNTSPTNTGSQSNGGGVYAKLRPHGSTVLGVMRVEGGLFPAADTAPPRATAVPEARRPLARRVRHAARQMSLAAFRRWFRDRF